MDYTKESRELRELVRILERNLGILEKTEVSCCGVTFAQCHAIVEIGRAKVLSLNDLAQILGLDNSTMSRTVNNLVADSFVERELDPKDRRYVTIKLTEKGIKVFENIEDSMGIYYQKIAQAIPESKLPQVMESLKILLEAMKTNSCCSGSC